MFYVLHRQEIFKVTCKQQKDVQESYQTTWPTGNSHFPENSNIVEYKCSHKALKFQSVTLEIDTDTNINNNMQHLDNSRIL